MIEKKDINKIKEAVQEFFEKMTITVSGVEASQSSDEGNLQKSKDPVQEEREVVNVEINSDEPQILIGQGGQTLFEIQRLLKNILNRKLKKIFFLNLDINDYKKKKIEYLKDLAKSLADQVS